MVYFYSKRSNLEKPVSFRNCCRYSKREIKYKLANTVKRHFGRKKQQNRSHLRDDKIVRHNKRWKLIYSFQNRLNQPLLMSTGKYEPDSKRKNYL